MVQSWPKNTKNEVRSDEELILAVQDGDKRAYDVLVSRFKTRLYNFILRMVGDPELAEEIAQDAFVRAYVNADKYRTIARFSTWLYTIAINLVRNHARKKKRSPIQRIPMIGREDGDKIELDAADTRELPDRDLERQEIRRHISEIMVKIPEHYREPFVLREMHDLSYEEIAAATGLKLGTVRSRINRARAHFKTHWTARFKTTAKPSGGPLQ
jgi:RNA polymerase sigma-70 factor, ECF subfamily